MALWICRQCTAAYAVGLPACPQCGSSEWEEEHMAKISRASGVTYEPGRAPEGAEPVAVEAEPVEEAEPKPAAKRAAKKSAAAGA